MSDRYDMFAHLENIRNYEKQLESETDRARRDLLFKLLDEEKARIVLPYVEKASC